MMKDLSAHTRIAPDVRRQTLETFINRINSNEEVQKEVGGWNLGFSEGLVQIKGRTLRPEKILMEGGQAVRTPGLQVKIKMLNYLDIHSLFILDTFLIQPVRLIL